MELSPKHCEYGRKMASAAWEAHETPRLSAKFSSYDPFKTARLNQAGKKKTNYVIAVGLLQHSPRRITKPFFAGPRSRVLSNPFKKLQTLVARSRCPVPVAQSRWPVLSRGPVRWPGPAGPVPVSRWPGRSRWPGPGPALRARARGPARKKTYSGSVVLNIQKPGSRAMLPLPA